MEIRGFRKEDEAGVRSLFAVCFGRELSHEEWTWKYLRPPLGSAAAVATSGEDIIAHYGGLKVRFRMKGQIYDVFQPCDVMTHPKYRARIFSRRGAMIRAGEYFYGSNPMDFAFGFPNERHAILGTRQLGYTEHGYVTVLTKKAPRLSLKPSPFLKYEAGWDSLDSVEIDDLLAQVRDDPGLTIEKDSRYIFWRYRDNPVREYKAIMVRARFTKELKAFMVCSMSKPDLLVLDFFVAKSLGWNAFLKCLEDIARRNALDRIRVWIHPAEDIFPLFLRRGYIREKGIPFIFKIMNKNIAPSFLFSNYFHRMGDYDAS